MLEQHWLFECWSVRYTAGSAGLLSLRSVTDCVSFCCVSPQISGALIRLHFYYVPSQAVDCRKSKIGLGFSSHCDVFTDFLAVYVVFRAAFLVLEALLKLEKHRCAERCVFWWEIILERCYGFFEFYSNSYTSSNSTSSALNVVVTQDFKTTVRQR